MTILTNKYQTLGAGLSRWRRASLMALLLIVAAGANAVNKTFDVKASLDSAFLLMGKTTAMHVEVVGPLDENGGIVLPDTLWREVEVAAIGEPKYTDLGNGRRELRQEITLQAFDSGFYTLPPVLYVQGNEVAESNKPVLKVIPVPVDTLATIHDYAPVQKPPYHFFDWVPDWMSEYGVWILLLLVLAAVGYYLYLVYKRRSLIPIAQTVKVEPPYDMAVRQLSELREQHLCERGEEKEYYTRLTDILRVYLERRFGINAMEMTTSQITRALKKNESTRLSEKYMARVLEIADFVKFARVRPLPDDNVQAFKSAMQFVEDTKPVEVAEPEEDVTPKSDDKKDPKDNKGKN